MPTRPSGLFTLLTTTLPQMMEINVNTNSKQPVTIEPVLILFDKAMFFRGISDFHKNISYVYHSIDTILALRIPE